MKSNRGFSLLETLLYLAIFAVVGGSLFGILTNMVRVTTREVSGDEVSSQLQFAIGSITRLVQSSSAIEMATNTATTTIKLRMPNSAQDPTCISVVGGVLKLAQGPDPFQKQNCTTATTDITTNKVVVDSAAFKRLEFPGGHDQVAIDMQLSNTATGVNKISRALRSAVSRASAATFDADLLPNADAQYEVGSSIPGGKRWRNATFSGNLTVSGNIGIGTTAPTSLLSVNGSADKVGGGSWGTFSDSRVKKNVHPFTLGLDAIMALQPVTFQYNGVKYSDDGKAYVGVIAQSVLNTPLESYTISTSTDGYYKWDSSAVTYALINAVKDQQRQIESQRSDIAELKAEVETLKNNK